jgi:hypothetical protein
MSAAKCETGWGDLSTRALFEGRDCHPTPPLISFASTLPLQGLSGEGKRTRCDKGLPLAVDESLH